VASVAAGSDKLVPWFTGWACLEAGQPPSSPDTAQDGRWPSRQPSPLVGGHLPYAPTVPGSHRAGPGDPGGALYGRTDPTATVRNLRGGSFSPRFSSFGMRVGSLLRRGGVSACAAQRREDERFQQRVDVERI
jgi:hypothetical protein